jgi:hypothetical protein
MRSSIVPDSLAFLLGFFIQLQKAGTQSEPACEIEEFSLHHEEPNLGECEKTGVLNPDNPKETLIKSTAKSLYHRATEEPKD